MALVVEDGSGVADADSYVSRNDADAYVVKYGNEAAWTGASDDDKDRALRIATAWLDGRYAGRWKGLRTYGNEQVLDWPRDNVQDCEDYWLPNNELPTEIVTATIIAAVTQLSSSTPLNAPNDGSSVKEEKSKLDELEYAVKYSGSQKAELISIPEIDRLLSRRCLLGSGVDEFARG